MRKNNLWQRIVAACNFVWYGKGKVRIMTCGKCGSPVIVPITEKPCEESYINGDIHIDLLWADITKCLKCGAVCQEIQMWNFEGNPMKVNPDIAVKN